MSNPMTFGSLRSMRGKMNETTSSPHREHTMRRAVALLTTGAALGAAGCGSTPTTKSTPEAVRTVTVTAPATTATPASAKAATPQTTPTAAPTPRPSPSAAGIGDGVTISGANGLKVRVTPTQIIDSMAPGEFDTVSTKNRLVGVVFRFTNTSHVSYDDSPTNGMTVIYGPDLQADASDASPNECSSPSDVKISPGDSRKFCVPFEIGKSNKLKKIQVGLDSGFSNQTGEWVVNGAR